MPKNKVTPFNTTKFDGKILVAEDNIINQKLIKQILIKYGIDVELANNGLEAFEKIKNFKYDLILMDIQMPVMDGLEATHEILNHEKEEGIPHTPIVALTANALKGDREKFLSEGLDEYLTKPIESDSLLEILKKFLRIHKEESTPPPVAKVSKSPKKRPVEKKVEEKKVESVGVTLLPELNDEPEDKKILIAKKNPLEAQILSKVLSNSGYNIDIISDVQSLDSKIQDNSHDILLIDFALEEQYRDSIKKQHKNMNVILLSLKEIDETLFDKTLIKEVLVGVMNVDELKYIINKYRGV
jgi:CheY-like chemotaxis protein